MRLFVQVRPSQQAVTHLREHLAPARTSSPDQWHVTLAFLGEVPAAGPLLAPLGEAAHAHAPFVLRLSGGGSFGRRTTWAGLGGDLAALGALALDVQAACRTAGVQLDDRPYRPHLTVGRVDPGLLASYDGPDWTVDELQLVHSVLGQRAVHTALHAFPLGYQA